MLDTLILPPEQTPFERAHLRRTNRIALAFFWLNLPLFVAVAFFNQTGPMLATGLTALVLAGPTIATALLDNGRWVSVVMGITAMCMGGLLVHFGQGPLQIEMHFYFFSLLACLSVFGNPMVIVAAAVTVTLHHLVLWMVLPSSVFNYDASVWVVLVHAAFVVVESVVAVGIARNYFDNVIGLEEIVAERTSQLDLANRSMRLVLEHVNQGLVTIDRDAQLATERSARVDEWVADHDGQVETMMDYLRAIDPQAAEWFELGWEDLLSGFLPLEVTIEQLPRRVQAGDQRLAMDYIPIHDGEEQQLQRVLVVMSDVTADEERDRAQAEQQQTSALVQRFLADRSALGDFVDDAARLVEGVVSQRHDDPAVCHRWLHTLKGNSLSMGLEAFGGHVHELETVLSEEARTPDSSERRALQAQWERIHALSRQLFGDGEQLVLSPHRLAELEEAVRRGEDPDALVARVRQLHHQPAQRRLTRLAAQAEGIGARVDKPVVVEVDCDEVYVGGEGWSDLWSALVHSVRNAVDHGIEHGEERRAAGKPEVGTLHLSLRAVPGAVQIGVRDDGRGIDWATVAARAADRGLPHATRGELEEALFSDGLTTARTTTELSGRGVGMSALRDAVQALGGTLAVSSEAGRGTTVSIRVPHRALALAS